MSLRKNQFAQNISIKRLYVSKQKCDQQSKKKTENCRRLSQFLKNTLCMGDYPLLNIFELQKT